MNYKLYVLLTNVKLYNYYSHSTGCIKYIHAKSIPFIYYPNYKPCFEANAYMVYLLKKNLSIFNGGTLLTYCIRISLLIKFISTYQGIDKFTDLTDEHIFEFIDFLRKRNISNNHIINIFKQCIDFLFFISEIYYLKYFIGFGNEFQIRLRKTKKNNNSFTHLSLPSPSITTSILPITLENIKKIRQSILKSNNQALRFRNICIIDLLEFTGARRSEIINLQVKNIFSANLNRPTTGLPLLEVLTLKKRTGSNIRKIPIPQNLLNNLLKYVRLYRDKIMKLNPSQDHDYLFISHKNGEPLKSDTLTTYLYSWSKANKIFPTIHAHQFRHRFITEKFKDLIMQHKLANPDEFSKLLLSHEKIKQQVLQWTGHTSISSLDSYIHFAIAEMTDLKSTCNHIEVMHSNTHLKIHLSDLLNDFENSRISEGEFLDKFKSLINE